VLRRSRSPDPALGGSRAAADQSRGHRSPQQRPSPLADFIDSLVKVAALDIDEVLPAHEYRFKGLTERVDHLLHHDETRVAEVVSAVQASPGVTSWQIAEGLTWSRPWDTIPPFLRRSAAGETLAHLILAQARGVVRPETQTSSVQLWFPVQRLRAAIVGLLAVRSGLRRL